MEAHLIYREVGGDKHFLCWDKKNAKAAWVSERMIDKVKDSFGLVSYKTRELAEDRARLFTINGKVLTKEI